MPSVMETGTYKNLKYLVRYPDQFDKNKKYPTILYLHGAGSRGTDLSLVASGTLLTHMQEDKSLPFVVFAPQCFADTWFEIFEQLIDFTGEMIRSDFVDQSRVYLTGASMGGYASWQLAMSRPHWFSAMVPVCGGGMYWNAVRLKELPIWAFHGMLDDCVAVDESIKMVNGVNKAGGHARLTLYPHNRHDSWTETYTNNEMYRWLLSNVKK